MGLPYVTVTIKPIHNGKESYEAQFLVNIGATDTAIPALHLKKIGIQPLGKMS